MEPIAVRRLRIPVDDPSPAGRVVVLFVSDDDDLRTAATRTLTHEGYDVVAAAHAGHALLACLSGRRIDVLVTELSMPDMSGPRLAERVHRIVPAVPVVYLGERGTRDAAEILTRPFTRGDLVERVSAALRGAVA